MGTTPATISADEFSTLMEKGAPCVLDVRTPAEFAECHVKGAKLAPLDSLDPQKAIEDLQCPPGSTVFILCKSGGRATKAAEKFHAAGIADVCVVSGGTDACVREAYRSSSEKSRRSRSMARCASPSGS